MRDVPTIVKELREIEEKGQLSPAMNHLDDCDSTIQCAHEKVACNTMFISDELQKLQRDSFGFTNLSVFLSTCVDFLELYPEPVCIIDNKGMITFMNHRFLNWIGFDPKDLEGEPFFSSLFFSKGNEQSMIQYALDPKNHQFNNPYEMIFQTKTGDQQPAQP